MNISLILGLLAAGLTMWFGVFSSVETPKFYMDSHALILVFGGTFAASLIGFPIEKLLGLLNALINWFSRKKIPDYKIVEELYDVAIYYRKYRDILSSVDFSHPFIREGFGFVKSEKFNDRQLQMVLSKRIQAFKTEMHNDSKMLTAMAKFPPAFGLLGASTGMITMMLNLNSGGSKAIGPAMAIALVATFWGIALANLIFLPLADFANKIAQDDSHTRLIIMDGLVLIKKGEDPLVMVEVLRSHLSPDDRGKINLLSSLPMDERTSSRRVV